MLDQHDKFMPGFIRFCREEFPDTENLFFVVGANGKDFYVSSEDCLPNKKTTLTWLKLTFYLFRAKRIILHGLFEPRLVLVLALNPWVLKKCYWIIWGGDLYQYRRNQSNPKGRITELLRKFVIRRIGSLVGCIPGDVRLVKSLYAARGRHYECFAYPSNLIENPSVKKKIQEGPLNVLVGNSADPSNGHIEVFEKIAPIIDKKVRIFSPLVYGNERYASEVAERGRSLFGERFTAIDNFMSMKEYRNFLLSIDIAIFNHDRQQAMGNIIHLLSMGKKVVVKFGTTHEEFLRNKGVTLYALDGLAMTPEDEGIARNNSSIVTDYFSRENLKNQLAKVLLGN